MDDVKRCETCGREFRRNNGQSQESWDAKRLCSAWCFCHPRKPKAVE